MSRIVRSTDVRAALRSRQRGFLLNPFRFGGSGGGGSISFVAANSGGWTSNSATLPAGWSAGDIAIVSAVAVTSAASISVPTGWTSITTISSGGSRTTVGYRVLQAGDTTTGTWTGAQQVQVAVYSGQHASPIGAIQTWTAVSTSQTYPAITNSVSNLSSYVIACGGKNNTSISAMGVPSGMTSRASNNCNRMFDSGVGVNSQSLLTAGDNGTNQYRQSVVFELKAA